MGDRKAQRERLAAANELLRVIASCGRRFFYHQGRVSQLELDERGRVWFWDKCSRRWIYTHHNGEWRRFSEGGTLRNLIRALREYIKRGTRLRNSLGPWPEWICRGDLWGYGEDMGQVRAAARRLGIAEEVAG